jgi:hypothetical protein
MVTGKPSSSAQAVTAALAASSGSCSFESKPESVTVSRSHSELEVLRMHCSAPP